MRKEDGQAVFVEPYEILEDFGEFLASVRQDTDRGANDSDKRNVKYAQTRKLSRSIERLGISY